MEHSLIVLLDELQEIHEKFHQPMALPASAEEIQQLQEMAAQHLNYKLPISYLEVLSRSNGIDWNGLQLYATHELMRVAPTGRISYERMGLVESNLLWRDFPPNGTGYYTTSKPT